VDTALDNGLSLWASGDNLWKGAALNALQNAELMVRGLPPCMCKLAQPETVAMFRSKPVDKS
jgi:hypothetical protein